MKPTDIKHPKLAGPIFTKSDDDPEAIFDYTFFPPSPDKVERFK